MTTYDERASRQASHLRALREFLAAELRDELEEARQEAQSALEAGDMRLYDMCLERAGVLAEKLTRCEPVPPAQDVGAAAAA